MLTSYPIASLGRLSDSLSKSFLKLIFDIALNGVLLPRGSVY